MEPKIIKLIELVSQEVTIFEQFLLALNQQQEALVGNDIESLETTTCKLESLTAKTREIESKRFVLVKEISQELQMGEDDVTLSKLIELVKEHESSQLARLQSTLLGLHNQITETKSRNDFLIKKSMEFVNNTITTLSGTEQKEATYSGGDKPEKAPSRTVLLDRRV